MGRGCVEDNVPIGIGRLCLSVHEDGYFGRKSVNGGGWNAVGGVYTPITTRSGN